MDRLYFIVQQSITYPSLSFALDGIVQTTNYLYNECFVYNENACILSSSLYDNTEYTSQSNLDVLKDYHYENGALYRLSQIDLIINGISEVQQAFTYEGNTTRINEISYIIEGSTYKYQYAYDELGNIINITYSEGTVIKSKNYYEYDGLNQIVLEDVYINDNDSTTDYTKIYTYAARGNRVATTTYNYEYRATAAVIPNRFLYNYGTVDVIPVDYYTVRSIDVGGDLPALSSFRYIDDILGRTHSISTVLVSVDFDPVHKGYYWATYRAVGSINLGTVNVYFKQRYKIGNLATTAGIITSSSSYLYDNTWLDQLDSYIGDDGISHTITYDNQGNPINITNFWFEDAYYNHADLSWFGRQLNLIEIFDGSNTKQGSIEYNYNDQGYRTKKIIGTLINGVFEYQTIEYELVGDKVIVETDGIYRIIYTYDYDGTIISFNGDVNINDTTPGQDYFYLRNQQGDITTIVDENGATIVQYRYDAYGNLTIVSDATEGILSFYNPYTYRGYRYDSEIGMYYLNSRFYNPQIGRFINADGMLGQFGDVQSTNMYAYCANNPVMYTDPSGLLSQEAWQNIGVAVFVIVLVTALVVCTGGLAAAALGASTATVAAMTTAGTIGGLVAGFANLAVQTMKTGGEELDIDSIALSSLSGSIAGLIAGAFGTLTSGTGGVTRLLIQKGMQAATNTIISVGIYFGSSFVSGEPITSEGLLISASGGFISGAFFNLPAAQGIM
ncbi:MAG: RHS repeat-associated core domain-containing protein, partial [Candidatus Izemoplasmatales bacterium]